MACGPSVRWCAAHQLSSVRCVLRAAAAVLVLAGCSANTVTETPAAQPTPMRSLSPVSTPTASPPAGTPVLSLAAIQRLDPRVGYIAGWTGTGVGLAKTSDAGATWQRITVPASRLTALRFIDVRVGWAGGFVLRDVPQIGCAQAAPAGASPCRGVVLRTEDGGRTWQVALSIPTDGVTGEPIRQLQAVDGQRAWVLTLAPPCSPGGCPSEVRRTTDGGRTWTTILRGGIVAIRFASAYRGWAALEDSQGDVEVRSTSDGGTTWANGPRYGARSFGFAMLDAATTQRAWLMTRDGSRCTSSNCLAYELFRTDDGGATWSSLGNPKDSAGAGCGGGFLTGPYFASPVLGWLTLSLGAGGVDVGPGGLLRTEDGGRTWTCSSVPPNTRLMTAADPLHVWVITDNRGTRATTLHGSEDGGRTWHALDLSTIQ